MKCCILVVDDDRDHAESIGDILTVRGYEVEMSFTGEDAVRRSAEREFDITLMDVKLPGINGVEAFYEVRRQRPNAQIIMMTGFSVELLLSRAVLSGAEGVLHKPFAATDLFDVLAQIDKPEKAA
jgi:two-component system, NtrC family, response regulator HydG